MGHWFFEVHWYFYQYAGCAGCYLSGSIDGNLEVISFDLESDSFEIVNLVKNSNKSPKTLFHYLKLEQTFIVIAMLFACDKFIKYVYIFSSILRWSSQQIPAYCFCFACYEKQEQEGKGIVSLL